MMTTCRDHSDDRVGITAIFDFRYYSWSSEHQDYDCNTLALTTISRKWISFVLPCFKHTSFIVRVTDSAQHSASHFEQWIHFLWQMSHKCVNCVLGCLEIMILVYPDPFRQAILCRNRTGINPMMQAGCAPILAHYGISARMWCFVKMKTFCSITLCLVTRQSFYSIVYRMW